MYAIDFSKIMTKGLLSFEVNGNLPFFKKPTSDV